MKISSGILCISVLLHFVSCVSALDFSNLDPMIYDIIGGIVGAVSLLALCVFCCCCRKKKSNELRVSPEDTIELEVPEIRTSGSRAVPEPAVPEVADELLVRSDPLRVSLPRVPNNSEHRVTTDAEHRRRLDAILATQASTAARESFHAGSTTRDHDHSSGGRPDNGTSGNPGHVPLEHQSSRHHLPTTPPASTVGQTDSHDRVTYTSLSDRYRTTFDRSFIGEDNDSILASFKRIPPSTATDQGHRSKKPLPPPTAQAEEQPEFMGIKLKPIVLNKAGGTYIPPEDF